VCLFTKMYKEGRRRRGDRHWRRQERLGPKVATAAGVEPGRKPAGEQAGTNECTSQRLQTIKSSELFLDRKRKLSNEAHKSSSICSMHNLKTSSSEHTSGWRATWQQQIYDSHFCKTVTCIRNMLRTGYKQLFTMRFAQLAERQ
jgi:hypothetical protein